MSEEKRKFKRYTWSEDSLRQAIESVKKGDCSVQKASLKFGIPQKTLRRRLETGIYTKFSKSQFVPRLNQQQEEELVEYIKKLEATGYTHNRTEIRKIAYDYAKRKGIEHVFDTKLEMAGSYWLEGFLRRHPDIKLKEQFKRTSIKKEESDNDDDNANKNDDNDGEDDYTNNDISQYLQVETNVDDKVSLNKSNPQPVVVDKKSNPNRKSQDSGFQLHYDDDLSEEEKRFYNRTYPTVDQVVKRRIHCTVCDEHIGTAPCQESLIRMHPVLKVTHCKKCHEFYNSGEFSKGEDGSELYCRWCGQGGEVYCCSKCPYVFCKNCIILNLSPNVISDIEENENWNCFVCAPKIMWHLRAQHWALMNFIEKQKKSISPRKFSESDIRKLMNRDSSTCCGNKNPPSSSSKKVSNIKISPVVSGSGGAEDNNQPDSSGESEISIIRKRKMDKKLKKVKSIKLDFDSDSELPKAKKQKSNNNDEVVCTPDVLSMLETDTTSMSLPKKNDAQVIKQQKNSSTPQPKHFSVPQQVKIQTVQHQRLPNLQNTPRVKQPLVANNQLSQHQKQKLQQTSTGIQTHSQQPPPLVIRNYSGSMRAITPTVVTRKTVVGPRPLSSTSVQTPVYHTINGFRIDLNSAAQHETFRLPNGKLIQVKRQGTVPNTTNISSTPLVHQQNGSTILNQVNRTPANQQRTLSTQAIITHNNQQVQHISLQPPQLATIRYTRPSQTINGNTGNTTLTTAIPAQGGAVLLNGTTVQQVTATRPIVSSIVNSPGITKRIFSSTPLGQARTQLQTQILVANEICQYLTGKIQSLTNSTAYNSVKSFTDVKDLYIHLSYLFTYAIGRFKSVQDKCLEDMRKLGFTEDAASLQSGQLVTEKNSNDADDDDIEIVEPKTTLIDLDSDDDHENKTGNKNQQSNSKQSSIDTIRQTTTSTPINLQQLPMNSETLKETSNNDVDINTVLLASMLEVDLHEIDGTDSNEAPSKPISPSGSSNSGGAGPKKPRKKMTNKPNPLLKQMELQGLEQNKDLIRRNDKKLKLECSVVLQKIDEVESLIEKELKDKNSIQINSGNGHNSIEDNNLEQNDDEKNSNGAMIEDNNDNSKLKLTGDSNKTIEEYNNKDLEEHSTIDKETEVIDKDFSENQNEEPLDDVSKITEVADKEPPQEKETEEEATLFIGSVNENIQTDPNDSCEKFGSTLDEVVGNENTATENLFEEHEQIIQDELLSTANDDLQKGFETDNPCLSELTTDDNLMIMDDENDHQDDDIDDIVKSAAAKLSGECEQDQEVQVDLADVDRECHQHPLQPQHEQEQLEIDKIQDGIRLGASEIENNENSVLDFIKVHDCIDESSKTQDSLFESISDTTLLETLSNAGTDNFLADFSLDSMVVGASNIMNNDDNNPL